MKNYIIGGVILIVIILGTVFIVQKQKKLATNINTSKEVNETKVSKITVFSPNGGEVWIKGTTQKIEWEDFSDTLSTHEVKIKDSSKTYTITNSQGNSYQWKVGENWNSPNFPEGFYTIEVCQTGSSSNCDSSNQPFEIKNPEQ